MAILPYTRRKILSASCLFTLLLVFCIQISSATVATATPLSQQHIVLHAVQQNNPEVTHLLQLKQSGHLAPTVNVLDSLPPTTILQFPLAPSGVKGKFPAATGLVTIVRGNRDDSTSDTVTVDVQNMPPDITFTIFFIEIANKPFGHVQYVADLHTRDDGSGDVTFQTITLVAFAADARNPGISKDQSGDASGTQLERRSSNGELTRRG